MDSLTHPELAAAAARIESNWQEWEQRFHDLFNDGFLRIPAAPGSELAMQIRPEFFTSDPAAALAHGLRHLEPALRHGSIAGIDLSAIPPAEFSAWLQEIVAVLGGATGGSAVAERMRFSLCIGHPSVRSFLQLRGCRALGYPQLALRFSRDIVRQNRHAWQAIVATSHNDRRLHLVPGRAPLDKEVSPHKSLCRCVMPLSLFETRPGVAPINLELDASCAKQGAGFRKQLAYSVRFADNLIDLQKWRLPIQQLDALFHRRVNFHVVGIGQMVVNASRDPADFATLRWLQRWLSMLRRSLARASSQLAGKRGAYPAFGGPELLAGLAPRYGIAEANRLVRIRSQRHQHALALSPFSFFPDELQDNQGDLWINLLPALGCADKITMYGDHRRTSLRLGSWSRVLQMAGAMA